MTGTNLTATLSGNTLSLSWPGDYLGWSLRSNSVGIASTNWFAVPNSSSGTQFNITIDPKKNVFYRMFLAH